MGFFASFWSWLTATESAYIGDNAARLASLLEPAVVVLATVYVMGWGYLHLLGKIDEPVSEGLKRIALLALVFGVGLRLWLYNDVIVDTFYAAPVRLAQGIVGGADPVGIVDSIWNRGGAVAQTLYSRSHYMSDLVALIAGLLIWVLVGVLCVYVMFLLAISSIALAILLALGPLFVGLALFDATRRLFVAWLAQMTNYALVTLLTVMASSFMLHVVESSAAQTAALGTGMAVVDAIDLLLVSVLAFLVLRQIMPIASGIAGGVSMHTLGAVSGAARWAARQAERPAVAEARRNASQRTMATLGRGFASGRAAVSAAASEGPEGAGFSAPPGPERVE